MKYTYSQADFPGASINIARFSSEISASPIVTALDRIDRAGGSTALGVTTGTYTVDVWFKATLSAEDETLLDRLVASHDNTPTIEVQSVNVDKQPRMREDGTIYAVPKPSSFGLVMCDRDIRINTCMLTDSVEDLKMNTGSNLEEPWKELTLVGVYKNVAGVMTLCTDQNDANTNGTLSVWDYHAKSGGVPVNYEVRDGLLYVDPALPANEVWDHRAYAVGAPTIPALYGGSIALFDAYLGANPDNTVAALSPQATVLDPAGPGGVAASTIRLYIVHPAGSKLSHVLCLVTYRAPGTF